MNITVSQFLNARAKERSKLLETDGLIIDFFMTGRPSDGETKEDRIIRRIKVSHIARDSSLDTPYNDLRHGGFSKAMPDKESVWCFNDRGHNDKSFKFEWV